MIEKPPSRAIRRLGLVTLLVALHAMALVLVLQRPASPPPLPQRAIAVVMVPAPVIAAVVPPPPPATLPVPLNTAPPTFDVTSEPEVPPGGCAMTAHVQTALRQNASISIATSAVPAAARTVANVITLWNNGWVDPVPLGGAGTIAPIRAAVTAAILSAPASCRAEEMVGPRLIFIPEAGGEFGTIVLAFGSGRWRWDDVSK